MALKTEFCDVIGSRKFKMHADKPEMLVSPLLDLIESRFESQMPFFEDGQLISTENNVAFSLEMLIPV